jgi:octaprenyl-diphosphate synthase
VLQLLNCHNADVEVDDYLQVIRYKTAKLFEAAARLGGILAGASRRLEEGWRPSACTSAPPSS